MKLFLSFVAAVALSLFGCGTATSVGSGSTQTVKVADHPSDPDTPECNDAMFLTPIVRFNEHTSKDESCTCAYAGDGVYYWRSTDNKIGNKRWCPPTSVAPFQD